MSPAQGSRPPSGVTLATGSRFAVVVSRFNELVTRALLAGALETFKRYRVPEANVEVSSAGSLPSTRFLQLRSRATMLVLVLSAANPAGCGLQLRHSCEVPTLVPVRCS